MTAIRGKSQTANALTALVSGGQTGAPLLPATFNRVTTVASAADSVMLPVAIAGSLVFVKNTSANALAIFPSKGDLINAAAVDAVYSLATVKSAIFFCCVNGTWDAHLSA
jgi:hypothetical protein